LAVPGEYFSAASNATWRWPVACGGNAEYARRPASRAPNFVAFAFVCRCDSAPVRRNRVKIKVRCTPSRDPQLFLFPLPEHLKSSAPLSNTQRGDGLFRLAGSVFTYTERRIRHAAISVIPRFSSIDERMYRPFFNCLRLQTARGVRNRPVARSSGVAADLFTRRHGARRNFFFCSSGPVSEGFGFAGRSEFCTTESRPSKGASNAKSLNDDAVGDMVKARSAFRSGNATPVSPISGRLLKPAPAREKCPSRRAFFAAVFLLDSATLRARFFAAIFCFSSVRGPRGSLPFRPKYLFEFASIAARTGLREFRPAALESRSYRCLQVFRGARGVSPVDRS